MFGTLVEVEGAGERRWGRLHGARMGRHMPMGRLRGYGRPVHLGSFGAENPTWVFDSEGNVTMGDTPAASPDYLTAILDTLKAVAPGVLGVVQAAVNRGVQGQAGQCPPGYSFWSPITGRCFRTAQEMGAADAAVQSAQGQYMGGGSGTNTMLIAGAVGLGVLGLFLALKK